MDIIKTADRALFRTMIDAAWQCPHPIEEEGGIILSKDGDYVFAKVKNIYAGTDTAVGLYETDQRELKEHVFSRLSEGWKMFSSFHTHPSFSATPSSLDLAKLFDGFKINIIYAPKHMMFSYSQWVGEHSSTYYIPRITIQNILTHEHD